MRITPRAAALLGGAVLLLLPTACGTDTPAAPTGPDATAGPAATGGPVLTVADSAWGPIVADGSGRTVYLYDKDTQGSGASTCTGGCAATWPAVTTAGGDPAVSGVTGRVGTITGVDGRAQVTLDGWPLYHYVGDTGPGDVAGQGVGGVWWVLRPDGSRLTAAATASAAPTVPGGNGYDGGY